MSEQEKDVQAHQEHEESSASTEEETNEESSEESTESEDRKTVPYDRFKEVNEELKKLKQERLDSVSKKEKKTETKPQTNESGLSEEDLFAIKQLDTKDELDYARKVAELEDVSLSEAIGSYLFTSWKAKQAEEKKKEETAMGASRGSGSRGKKKEFSTPGLSPNEHKKMFRKKLGME